MAYKQCPVSNYQWIVMSKWLKHASLVMHNTIYTIGILRLYFHKSPYADMTFIKNGNCSELLYKSYYLLSTPQLYRNGNQ